MSTSAPPPAKPAGLEPVLRPERPEGPRPGRRPDRAGVRPRALRQVGRTPARGRRAEPRVVDDRLGGGEAVGCVRMWPIHIGRTPAVLLGPFAVDDAWRSRGLGGQLIEAACAAAARSGPDIVLLVGDAPYFQKLGFEQVPARRRRAAGPGRRPPRALARAEAGRPRRRAGRRRQRLTGGRPGRLFPRRLFPRAPPSPIQDHGRGEPRSMRRMSREASRREAPLAFRWPACLPRRSSSWCARRWIRWTAMTPGAAAASDHDLNPEIALPIDGLLPAAVLVALIERPEGLSVLFTQRADQLRRHAGQIAFPGGGCEQGETPWQAALREAHEEVGLDPALVRLGGLAKPYRTITGFHIVPGGGFRRGAARLRRRRRGGGRRVRGAVRPSDGPGQPRTAPSPGSARSAALVLGHRLARAADLGRHRGAWCAGSTSGWKRPMSPAVDRLPVQDWMSAPATRAVIGALEAAGGKGSARFVGGAVRNALIGRPIADVDIATVLTPDEAMAALKAAGVKFVPHRRRARHRHRDLREQAVRGHHPAPRRGDGTAAAPWSPSPPTGPRTPSAAISA
ncbi:MAG: GNAT family N-acetyltransferase [Caulobacteraceae bacterium]